LLLWGLCRTVSVVSTKKNKYTPLHFPSIEPNSIKLHQHQETQFIYNCSLLQRSTVLAFAPTQRIFIESSLPSAFTRPSPFADSENVFLLFLLCRCPHFLFHTCVDFERRLRSLLFRACRRVIELDLGILFASAT
jgi:hypothetical protein